MKFVSLSTMVTPVISIYLYENCVLVPQSTYICRVQSCVWRLPQYWPPNPLSTQRVCPPPSPKAGGTHTLAGRWVDGGSIFWKTPDIGLASYSIISLRFVPLTHSAELQIQVLSILCRVFVHFARDKWRQPGSLGYKRWLIREPSSLPFLKIRILCVSTLELCTSARVHFLFQGTVSQDFLL